MICFFHQLKQLWEGKISVWIKEPSLKRETEEWYDDDGPRIRQQLHTETMLPPCCCSPDVEWFEWPVLARAGGCLTVRLTPGVHQQPPPRRRWFNSEPGPGRGLFVRFKIKCVLQFLYQCKQYLKADKCLSTKPSLPSCLVRNEL